MSTATGKLTFTNTMSIKAYALQFGANKLDFVKNPNTGKTFGSFDSGATAALAGSLDKDNPMFVSNCTDDDGVTFLMIHNRSESANIEHSIAL